MNKEQIDGGHSMPITVIGGYLGAGKTTLLNHLLRHADGKRLAILVNDFGTLAIDEALIEARDETVISIAGGCVCCSYGSDMMGALIALSRLDTPPDHVLLEASGVAFPDAIAQSVQLLDTYRLDATVVLADAETIRSRAVDVYLADTVIHQLQAADIVILNKADTVDPKTLDELCHWLKQLAPEARLLVTSHAAIAAVLLVGSGAVSSERPWPDVAAGHGRHRTTATHHSSAFTLPGLVDAAALARGLTRPTLDLVRAKGVVRDSDGSLRVIQVVGRRWQVSAGPERYSGASQFVCIRVGPPVDRDAVEQLIASCLSVLDPSPERCAGQQTDQVSCQHQKSDRGGHLDQRQGQQARGPRQAAPVATLSPVGPAENHDRKTEAEQG